MFWNHLNKYLYHYIKKYASTYILSFQRDDKSQIGRPTTARIPGRQHARRRSMSDEEDEYVSDVTTTSTKHASDYIIPIYSDSTGTRLSVQYILYEFLLYYNCTCL